MKTATLTRNMELSGPQGTFGTWLSITGFKCVIMERPPGGIYPCIPTGEFICKLRDSNAFKNKNYGFGYGKVYGLDDVPGRTDILIHSANFPIGIKTNTEQEHLQLMGCLAPGTVITKVQAPAPDGRMIRGIINSVIATKALMADMGGQPFRLKIV